MLYNAQIFTLGSDVILDGHNCSACIEILELIPLRKRLRIRSVISVNYHFITVLCPFNLLIRFQCYTSV